MVGSQWGYIFRARGGGGGTLDQAHNYVMVRGRAIAGGGDDPFGDCGGITTSGLLQENGDFLLLNDSVSPAEGGRDGCIILLGGDGGGG